MSDQLFSFISSHRGPLEQALAERLPVSSRATARRLNEAIRYAVFPGGKRLRPLLTLLGANLVGGCRDRALAAACAIEFLHTSSLVLDDMPAMDDAELRRGRAALHLAYGEALATLAALALLNQAYALLARAAAGRQTQAAERLIIEAVECIGVDGMIGGQAADLEPSTAADSADVLDSRGLKTTSLMRLTLSAGAVACGADEGDSAALARFGYCLGAAYQILDDLLDEVGDSSLTGKTPGQDARHLRLTFIAELGVEGAGQSALSLVERGKSALFDRFGDRGEARLLAEAADFIIREVCRYGLVTDFV